jgi:gluconate 2-dehydrogenase subunit 3-like protein
MPGRRAFLGGALWAALTLRRPAAAPGQAVPADPSSPVLPASLEALVDTIVPRDQDPGGLDAGVHTRILARLPRDRAGLELYRDGLELLDRLARGAGALSFRALPGAERERILSSLASGPAGPETLGERFFHRARRDVLAYYWGSVVGQRVVGYRPPLSGYPEYADPPRGPESAQP